MKDKARQAQIEKLKQARADVSEVFRHAHGPGARKSRAAAIRKMQEIDRQIHDLEQEIEAERIRASQTTCRGCGLVSVPVPSYVHKADPKRAARKEWAHAYCCPHKWKALQLRLGKRLEGSEPDSYVAGVLRRARVSCKACGQKYFDPNSSSWNRKGVCCDRCEKDARNDQLKRERLEAKPARTCEHCGESLDASQRMGARFCSTKCRVYASRKKAAACK